jgi:hypothetical protein
MEMNARKKGPVSLMQTRLAGSLAEMCTGVLMDRPQPAVEDDGKDDERYHQFP